MGLGVCSPNTQTRVGTRLSIQRHLARRTQAGLLLNVMNLGKPLAMRGSREAVQAVSHWLTQRGLALCDTYYRNLAGAP